MAIIQYILLLLFFLVYYYFSRLIIRYCITHTTFFQKIILYVRYCIVKVFVYNFFDLIMLITTIFQKIMQEIRAPTYKGYKNRITIIG